MQKKIGDIGEELVLNYLKMIGAENILWIAQLGETPGYDISYEVQGEEFYLEVKSTQASTLSRFIITQNELNAAMRLQHQFKIALVTDVLSPAPKMQFINNPFISNNTVEVNPLSYIVKFK